MKRYMKHVKVLSNEMPVQAQQTAWVELKNIVGVGPGSALTAQQAGWLAGQINAKLTR